MIPWLVAALLATASLDPARPDLSDDLTRSLLTLQQGDSTAEVRRKLEEDGWTLLEPPEPGRLVGADLGGELAVYRGYQTELTVAFVPDVTGDEAFSGYVELRDGGLLEVKDEGGMPTLLVPEDF